MPPVHSNEATASTAWVPPPTPQHTALSKLRWAKTKTLSTTLYGSMQANSSRGRLAELRTAFMIQKRRFHFLLLTAFVGCTLWPIGMLALPVIGLLVLCGFQRLSWALSLLSFLTIVAILVLSVPAVCLVASDSLREDLVHGRFQQLSLLDTANLFVDHLQILVFLAFMIVSHGISVEVTLVKDQVQDYWREQSQKKGMMLHLSEEQRHTMADAGYEPFKKDIDAALHVWDFINQLLATLPGWESGLDALEKQELQQLRIRESRAKQTALSSQSIVQEIEAVENGETPIKIDVAGTTGLNVVDVYVLRLHQETVWDLLTPSFVLKECKLFSELIKNMFLDDPVCASLIWAIATFRAILPRIWSHFILGGPFLPTGPAAWIFVVHGSLLTAFVTGLWGLIFLYASRAYAHNAVQMTLTTSLVCVQRRADYADYVAQHNSIQETERLLRLLPLLDLRETSNLLAFWRVRQFVMLDQTNERITVELLLEILLGWLLINVGLVLMTVLGVGQAISDIGCLMVLDLLFAGFFAVVMLDTSIKINSVVDHAANALVEVRHDLLLRQYGETEKGEEDAPNDRLQDLLGHLIEKIDRNDEKQRLFFGAEITPMNLLVFVGSIVFAIFGIFEQFVALGIITNVFEQAPSLHGNLRHRP